MDDQRQFWKTGATRPLAFRRDALQKLRRAIDENRDALCDAVYKDLRRPQAVTMAIEVEGSIGSIDHCLAHLDQWAAIQKVRK